MYNLIKKTFILMIENPYILYKKIKARIKSLFPINDENVRKPINNIIFEFDFNYDPVISQMYFGGYEIETIEIMKKYLKKGNIFIDVGANIGYLTAIGAGFVGTTGQVHSFEPVPKYFQRLNKIPNENSNYCIVTNPFALGEKKGELPLNISAVSNIGWNTLVPGFMPSNSIGEIINVPIQRLDDYIIEKNLKNIALIKIDVEGFEFPVLLGLSNYLSNQENRPPIICEIAPSSYPLMGYSIIELKNYMEKNGYYSCKLANPNKHIDIEKITQTTTILFLSYNSISQNN
jgi:FkbM family methyltransferase